MATEILAVDDTAADSTDVVVAPGESLTVALKGLIEGQDPQVDVSLKDDDGDYNKVGYMSTEPLSNRSIVINAPGTYRFTRRAGDPCGVYSG